jgi:hypothetical protein
MFGSFGKEAMEKVMKDPEARAAVMVRNILGCFGYRNFREWSCPALWRMLFSFVYLFDASS